MNIAKFATKNKYLIITLIIAIVLLGVYSRITMQVQLAPDTNPPMVTVMLRYPGVSAEDVSKDVAEPIEKELAQLEGISNIKSTSQDNMSIIQISFDYATDVNEAAIDVQNSISRIKSSLPERLEEPRVLKISTADKPVTTIALTSNSLSMEKLRQIADDEINYNLQLVDGVSGINIYGGYSNEVQIEIDKKKIAAYNISLEEISNILGQNNIKAPGGNLVEENKEVLLRIEEGFSNKEDINNLRIPTKDGHFIYLRDIADVRFTHEDLESSYRLNGEEAIAISITKKNDANTIEVIENIKDKLNSLEEDYPFIDFQIAQDDSIFTLQMVENMTSSVSLSIGLTVLLIMLFISALNQSLIVSVSMPLTFLMTLGIMKFSGLKLDLVTLSALILSIGFVVDASIVVVENIVSHSETNDNIVEATIDAVSEVTIPILTGALTTLAVLFPLVFIKGFVGAMFKPLSLTLIYSISSSMFIALFIIPVLAIMFDNLKLTKIEKIFGLVSCIFNKIMDLILDAYVGLLKFSLKNKLFVYIVLIIGLIISAITLDRNGVEMLPQFDSAVTYISIELESGAKLEETKQAVSEIEKYLSKKDNIVNYDVKIGFEKGSNTLGDFGLMTTNQASFTINLNNRTERIESIWEFQEELRQYISRIPGIKRFVVREQGGTATAESSAPIAVSISGPEQDVLFDIASKLELKMWDIYGTTNIYKNFHMDNEQISIKTNNAKIQEFGLTNASISRQILNSVEGIQNSSMDVNQSDNLNISIGYKKGSIQSLDDILDIYINTPVGAKVPLRELASLEINNRSNLVTRGNYSNTIEILSYTHTRAFSHIVSDIQEVIDNFSLPSGYDVKMVGQQEELGNSMKDMAFTLILAIIFVYLILVPQFKSFVQPLIVMSAIPLVIIGVAPALVLSGKNISMPVLLGFILLAGTVVNDSILLVDNTNNLRKKGLSIDESLIQSVKNRYRPIMMTTLSDVAGMLPLAFELALGAERFSPLAITVIGGMLASTLLTLIIIPITYSITESFALTFNKIGHRLEIK